MNAVGRQPEDDIARGNGRPGQNAAALHRSHRKAGKIIIPVGVKSRHFRGFTADQRTPGLPASGGNPADDRPRLFHGEPGGGIIIQEEQGLSALDHQVVDAHGDQVDADRVVPITRDGQLQLGADTIGRGDEQRIGEAGRPQIEQRPEAAEFVDNATPPGCPRQRPDRVYQPLACGDVDARVLIGEAADGFPRVTC